MASPQNFEPWLAKFLPKSYRDLLTQRSQASIVLENSVWLIFERVVRLVLGIFVGAWVAKYLGPSQFGELNYVLAFIAFFQAASGLGLDAILVREFSRDPERVGEYLGSAAILRVFAGSLAWILAVIIMSFLEKSDTRVIVTTAIIGSCLVFQAADVFDFWFQSYSLNRLTVKVKLVSYIASALIKIGCILAGANLFIFAAIVTLECAFVATGLILSYRKFSPKVTMTFSVTLSRKVLKESWILVLASLATIAYMRIDLILIKSLLGVERAGIYAAVMPLSTLWHVIPVSICSSAAPIIARKKIVSEEDYYNALTKIFRLCLVSGIIICCLVFSCSDFLIVKLYGEQFSEAGKILKIHVFTNIPVFLGVARSLWITNEGRQWINFWCTLAGALFSVAINSLFLRKFGLSVAASTAVLSYFVSAVFSSIFFDHKIFLMQMGFSYK